MTPVKNWWEALDSNQQCHKGGGFTVRWFNQFTQLPSWRAMEESNLSAPSHFLATSLED